MAGAQARLRATLAGIRIKTLGVPADLECHGPTCMALPLEIAEKLVEQVVASVRWEASMRYLLS